jgi:hypothetical protein
MLNVNFTTNPYTIYRDNPTTTSFLLKEIKHSAPSGLQQQLLGAHIKSSTRVQINSSSRVHNK